MIFWNWALPHRVSICFDSTVCKRGWCGNTAMQSNYFRQIQYKARVTFSASPSCINHPDSRERERERTQKSPIHTTDQCTTSVCTKHMNLFIPNITNSFIHHIYSFSSHQLKQHVDCLRNDAIVTMPLQFHANASSWVRLWNATTLRNDCMLHAYQLYPHSPQFHVSASGTQICLEQKDPRV